MIRHISIFFYRENAKEEEKIRLREALIHLGTELVGNSDYSVGENCAKLPPLGAEGTPEFGDLAQIIDFRNPEDAENYPHNPGHMEIVKKFSYLLEKVIAMDYLC